MILKKNRILIENFSYLALLQIITIIIPLVIYPFLILHIGVEKYGLVIFSQSIVLYLVVLVNFGLNLFATKEIAIHKDDKKKLSVIISTVFFIKISLLLFSLVVLSALVFSIPFLKEYWYLYYLSIGVLIYETFVPVWYFQGIEKMKFITLLNVSARLIFTGFIIIFVSSPQDFWLVPMFNLIGFSLSSILSIYIVFFIHNVGFILPVAKDVKNYIKSSFPFFITLLSMDTYIRATPIIIGSLIGLKEVAYFDLAEKILSAFKSLIVIISQTIYPKISREKNKLFTRKMFLMTFVLISILVLFVFILSGYIVEFFLHSAINQVENIISILILGALFVVISNFASNQMLIPNGYDRYVMKATIVSMFMYFISILLLYLIVGLELVYVAIILTSIELFLALILSFLAYKFRVI